MLLIIMLLTVMIARLSWLLWLVRLCWDIWLSLCTVSNGQFNPQYKDFAQKDYAGTLHEILFEKDGVKVEEDIVDWLDEKV